ncbi:MAG: hypothetical protein HKN31_12825 [Pricia sp.]|nr:hypothetical protein [Pricia sp.]
MARNIKIRTAALTDLERVFTLASQLSESVTIDRPSLERNFATIINDEHHLVLVAESKNSVVGYLSGYMHTTIYANGKTAYVDEIVVLYKKKGNGI